MIFTNIGTYPNVQCVFISLINIEFNFHKENVLMLVHWGALAPRPGNQLQTGGHSLASVSYTQLASVSYQRLTSRLKHQIILMSLVLPSDGERTVFANRGR